MKKKETQTKRLNVKKEFEQVRKEIKETEMRLEFKIDSKVDIATQSMKDYVDIKFDRMQNNFNQIQTNFNRLGNKLDTAVKGIVDMIERSLGDQLKIEDQVQNHEHRINLLETKIV